MAAQVYLAYAPEDEELVGLVRVMLEGQGITCFLEARDSVGGPHAEETTNSQGDPLAEAQVLLVVFTVHTCTAPAVLDHVALADEQGLQLVVFRAEEAPCPPDLEQYLSKAIKVGDPTQPLGAVLMELVGIMQEVCTSDEHADDDPEPIAGAMSEEGHRDTAFSIDLSDEGEPDAPGSVDMLDLRLSAFHPREVVAEEMQRLVAYAHIESAKTEVARHALEALELAAEEVRAVSEAARRPVSREAEVLVVPQAEGLTFSPSQQFLSLWEDWQAAEFRFRAAADRTGGACSGSVMFLVEGMLIAEVPVSVFVRAADADSVFGEEMAEVAATPYRRIFPSHSHQDIGIITACERYAAMCGDEYLRDVRMLRSGEEWSPRLLELIDDAEVFQLFWSPNAARSRYVEEEWRYALTRQSASFIRPIYWQHPLADPPIELGHIHFAYVELGPGLD